MSNPDWNTKLMITSKDVVDMLQYIDAGITMNSVVSKVIDELKAGAEMTLEKQRVIARWVLAVFAERTHPSVKDSFFDNIVIECTENLLIANKIGASNEG